MPRIPHLIREGTEVGEFKQLKHLSACGCFDEGTVAYAVTVLGLAAGAAGPTSPDIILDRPFVYFIRAGATGLILFAGVVNNPDEKT